MPAPSIHVVGPAFLDQIFWDLPAEPRLGTEVYCRDLVLCPGGVTTTAIALARLGAEVSLGTVVGDDLYGDYIAAQLDREGVDGTNVRRQPGWTTPLTASLARLGDRALVTYLAKPDEGALPPLALDARPGAQAVLLAVPWEQRSWFPVVGGQEAGAPCYVDLGWVNEPGVLEHLVSVVGTVAGVLPNEVEALRYTGRSRLDDALHALVDVVPLAAVKLGRSGALALQDDGQEVHVAGLQVEAQDTTGAGDIFDAGFLFARTAGASLAAQVALGVAVSGLSVAHLGTSLAAPCWKEVVALLSGEERATLAVDDEVRDELLELLRAGSDRQPCQRSCRRLCSGEIGGSW